MSDDVLATSYGKLLVDIENAMSASWDWPSPEAAFAAYVYHAVGEAGPCGQLRKLTWPRDERILHAPSLAAAGFLLNAGVGEQLRDDWLAAVARFQSSNLFIDRQSFPYRPVELLGIVAGVAFFVGENPQLGLWAKSLLERTREIHGYRGWSGLLQASAEFIIGGRQSQPANDIQAMPSDELALSSWMSRALERVVPPSAVDKAFLKTTATTSLQHVDLARSAVLHCSLRDVVSRVVESEVDKYWQVNRKRRDGEALVVALCRRFHLFAEQLLVRHGGRTTVQIHDEYDVQDLMHAILQLHFEDVRAEEVTPSVGGKTGRMDFLLKREQLAIETKMTRKGLDQKKVGDELMVDMTRYRAHPAYRTLVCFVYDPEGLCHNPTALEDDLTKSDGDFRTVVVVCPKGL